MTGKKSQDVALGAVICLVAAAFLFQTAELAVGAALFPRIALGGMLASGVLIAAKAALSQTGEGYITLRGAVRELAVPAAILFGCGALFQVLGFYICSFLIVALVGLYEEYLEGGRPGKKAVLRTLLLALGVTVFLVLVFALLLRLPTPQGIFGF